MQTIAASFSSWPAPLRFGGKRGVSLGLALVLAGFMAGPAGAAGQPALAEPHDSEAVPAGLEKSDWGSIRAAYEAGRHEVRAVDGGHEAHNPGQGWRTRWDGQGFLSQPVAAGDGTWQWGLALSSYGFAGAEQTVSGKATVRTEGQRLTYQWDSTVEEWYVNDGRGLEHGFTVAQRPQGISNFKSQISNPLAFSLRVRGGLRPEISGDAQAVRFLDAAGSAVVTYSGLKVWDADGKILPSHFAAAERDSFRLLVDERGARYPLTIDPLAQQAYLKASNTGAGDQFGASVAISGDTVVIGAPDEDSGSVGVNSVPNESSTDSGAAYIFVHTGATWAQQAYLKASNTGAGDGFGVAVSISGDTIGIGAAMGVNVFARTTVLGVPVWFPETILRSHNWAPEDDFGASVSASGDTLLAGAPNEDGGNPGVNPASSETASSSGAAFIFRRTGAGWIQEAYLKSADPRGSTSGPFGSPFGSADHFGLSVSLDGDTAAVAGGDDFRLLSTRTPQAAVFTRTGSTWAPQAEISGVGATVFGHAGAVSVSGDRMVVRKGSFAFGTGELQVFIREGGAWTRQASYPGRFPAAAISGLTVAGGNEGDSSAATGVNGNAADNGAPESGAASILLFSTLVPAVSTKPATGVTSSSALLNGRIYAGSLTTTVRFEYSLYNPFSPPPVTSKTLPPPGVSGNDATNVFHPLSGLEPGRTYQFRVLATNSLGTGTGDWLTFTTAPAAPTVETLPIFAPSLTHNSATLDGTVSARGAETAVAFTYTGPDGFPRTVAASPSPVTTTGTPVAVEISGLFPETTYSFYATRVNSMGTTTSTPVRTFTTLPDPAAVGGVESFPNPTITGGSLYGSVAQPDGGTLLFGTFTTVNGSTRNRIARLTSSATLDASFNPNTNGDIVCAAVLNDGKILIGGNFTLLQPGGIGTTYPRNRLARLNANGTVDTTFADPAVNAYVLCMAVQPDGAVLVGGDFTSFMGAMRNHIARITSSGTLDASFNPNANASVYAIAPQTDGSILLGGAFTTMGGGAARDFLAKVNGTTGSVLTYSGSASSSVYTIALQRDGKAVVGGTFTTMNGTTRNRLARLNTNGSLDLDFVPALNGDVRSLALQTNDKIIVGGAFSHVAVTPRNKLARVTSAGIADAFNPNIAGGDVYGTALQKDGRVHAAGTFTTINGSVPRSGFAVLNNETAFETLEKRSDTYIRLNRAAAAPQASYVIFEKSTDGGATWTPLGTVQSSVATPDFILTGINPPLPETAKLRARARTSGGYFNGSAGLTETILDYNHPKPTLTAVNATDITGTSAVFRSTVNANGNQTEVFYNYSVNPTPYDHTVSGATATGSVAGPADLAVHGLLPGTTYRFESVAVNIGGVVTVTGANFTTLSNLNAIYNTGAEIPATGSGYVATGRNVTFTLNYAPTPGTTLMVVNNTGSAPITGAFANLAQGQAVDLTYGPYAYPFVAHYYGGTGNDLVLLWRNTRAVSWGWNNLAQLGLGGSSDNQGAPVAVAGGLLDGKTLVSMSGGFQHSVALCVDGTIATWGDNLEGQLGNGDDVDRSSTVPTAVEQGFLPGGIHPVAVSAGGSHTLALFSNGQVYGWGDNEYGQVGNGSSVFDENLPALAAGVLSGKRVIGISAGEYHSLAVCDDGFVAAWGLGDSGQLGNGDTSNQKSPVAVDLTAVPPGETFIAVAAGRWHSMALTSSGKVFTWGNNQSGQLGDGDTSNQKYPILVPGLTATAIYGGGTYHSLALRSDGKLVAWGTNIYGQLGTGDLVNSFTPTPVNATWQSGQSLAAAVSGDEHNLAMRSDGKLYAWGLGNEGRLGDNDIGILTQPVQKPVDASVLDPGDRWQGIYSGADSQHSLAIIAVSLEPTATTLPAFVVSDTEAILYGRVNAHGLPTNMDFEYGLDASYGSGINAAPFTLSGINPTVVSAALTGLVPGQTYHYRVLALQGGTGYAFGDDFTFATSTRLQMWRENWFGTKDNTGDAANDADSDQDGITNLLEFAFGLDPRQNSAGQLPEAQFYPDAIHFQFAEPNTHMGLTYGAEWSTTLAPGSWTAIPDAASSPNHRFKLTTTGLPRVFVRLKVTVPPP